MSDEPSLLEYRTPTPPEPPRTARAVARICVYSLVLGIGLLLMIPVTLGILRVAVLEDRNPFPFIGLGALMMVALALTVSGVMQIVLAVQWLRRVPESENRVLQAWKRINNFGRRR